MGSSCSTPRDSGRFDTARVGVKEDLARAVADWVGRPRGMIVEVACERRESPALRSQLIARAVAAVDGSVR
jgi:hypothetical protein